MHFAGETREASNKLDGRLQLMRHERVFELTLGPPPRAEESFVYNVKLVCVRAPMGMHGVRVAESRWTFSSLSSTSRSNQSTLAPKAVTNESWANMEHCSRQAEKENNFSGFFSGSCGFAPTLFFIQQVKKSQANCINVLTALDHF